MANFSGEGIVFALPDPASAALHLKFRVFDHAGTQVWESEPPSATHLETLATLARKAVWKRTVQVPLKVNGAWLASGRYRLEAYVPGDSQVAASTIFEVAALGLPPNTGLEGQVRQAASVHLPSGFTATVMPWAVKAHIEIRQVAPSANTPAAELFSWSGTTDNQGRYRVATPAGRFQVSAKSLEGDAPPVVHTELVAGVGLLLPVTVTAGQYAQANVLLSGAVVWDSVPANTGIHGTVLQKGDADGMSLVPLVGAKVVIRAGLPPPNNGVFYLPGYQPPGWNGTTDEYGQFVAPLHAGSYRVEIYQLEPTSNPLAPKEVLVAAAYSAVTSGAYTDVTLTAASNPPPSERAELVMRVNSATAVFDQAGVLKVTANGSVSTGGWTNGQLMPRPTNETHHLEFDLVADPPTGTATQVVSPSSGSREVPAPGEVWSIRIHSQTNDYDLQFAQLLQ